MFVSGGDAAAKLEAYTVEQICDDVANSITLTQISKNIGVATSTLLMWIKRDPQRDQMVKEARRVTAWHWDEMAEYEVRQSDDMISLQRAKELASHYRWRSSKIAPDEYGDRVKVNTTVEVKDDESRLAELLRKAGINPPAGGETSTEGA